VTQTASHIETPLRAENGDDLEQKASIASSMIVGTHRSRCDPLREYCSSGGVDGLEIEGVAG